ncbi:MAG: hypothetical protein EAY75_18325 [Bacteroidetes bacterium]|nr:MAG: hypothetical protein EAY75_18325 [Bacteroidota bacterium]
MAQPGLYLELNTASKRFFSLHVQSRLYNSTGLQLPSEKDTNQSKNSNVNDMYNLTVRRASLLKQSNGVLMNTDLGGEKGKYEASIMPYKADATWIVLLIHAFTLDEFKVSDTPTLNNPMLVFVPIAHQAQINYVTLKNLKVEPGKVVIVKANATYFKTDDTCKWLWDGKKQKAIKPPPSALALQLIQDEIAQKRPSW